MPIGSVKSGSSSGFFPTGLVNFGKSTVAKVIELTTVFFRITGIAALYRGVWSLFSRDVKKDGGSGSSASGYFSSGKAKSKAAAEAEQKQQVLIEELDQKLQELAPRVESLTQAGEAVGTYRGGADFREKTSLKSLQDYLRDLGFSALAAIQDARPLKCNTVYSYEQALVAHEMAQLEATKAIATCPQTKGCQLSFVSGDTIHFTEANLTIAEDAPQLDANIFSWAETKGVEKQLGILLTKPEAGVKHIFVAASQYNGTECPQDLTPKPGSVMDASVNDNTQGPKAQRVRAALFELINWGLGCLGFNCAIHVLDEETYSQYNDGYLVPRSISGLAKLVHQFYERGNRLIFPYVKGEAFDMVLAAAPDLQQEINKRWSLDPKERKERMFLEMYTSENMAFGGADGWNESFFRSKMHACQSRPLTSIFKYSFSNFQRSLADEDAKQRRIQAIESVSDEAYKAIANEFIAAWNPEMTEEQFNGFKERIDACFQEPLREIDRLHFWEMQEVLAVPGKREELIQRVAQMPTTTPAEQESQKRAEAFLNAYRFEVTEEEYDQFKKNMQLLQHFSAYASFTAQFNGLKKALEENPSRTVKLHLTGVGMGVFGNKGRFVGPAFYQAAQELEQWLRENGHEKRTRVVYEAFTGGWTGALDDNSQEFIDTVKLQKAAFFS